MVDNANSTADHVEIGYEYEHFGLNETAVGDDVLDRNVSLDFHPTAENSVTHKTQDDIFQSGIIIPLYVVIFVLSVVGNSLVLVTLGQNKRMRTVTNVYLLNLAVSDLLLGVFCMPFTLVGQVLKNFIFGATMCKMIPYFQAVSVSVGVWTLVAISLERYFAICRPLKSRRWQTQFHAYKMIVFVWISSFAWNSPILLVSRLKALKMGRHKCREEWPNPTSERIFNMFLDVVLLLVPLIIMSLAYSLIVSKLWKGLRHEIRHNTSCNTRQDRCTSTATVNGVVLNKDGTVHDSINLPGCSSKSLFIRGETRIRDCKPNRSYKTKIKKIRHQVTLSNRETKGGSLTSVITLPVLKASPKSLKDECQAEELPYPESMSGSDTMQYALQRHAVRSNYMDKSIEAKKKVIRMLFVVMSEFFICWAPLHILNTWYLFSPEFIYKYVGANGISLVQLLAYISSCCNPITYCFMNRKFRQAFLNVFNCCRIWPSSTDRKNGKKRSFNHGNAPINSEVSGNYSLAYPGRIVGTYNRSEIVVLESEDRV